MMAHGIASAHRATVLGSVTEQSFQQAEVIDVAVDETSPHKLCRPCTRFASWMLYVVMETDNLVSLCSMSTSLKAMSRKHDRYLATCCIEEYIL